MMAAVNSSFLRRSGVRNALIKAESKFFLLREAGRSFLTVELSRAFARHP
jgi:hypothetical protein